MTNLILEENIEDQISLEIKSNSIAIESEGYAINLTHDQFDEIMSIIKKYRELAGQINLSIE